VIHKVTIKRFKKLDIEELEIPSQVVLAGPNNTGKTTILQAIAAWALALRSWRAHNDFGKHNGAYAKVPISRAQFFAVPLREFNLLFKDRAYSSQSPIEIRVRSHAGWDVTMLLIPDSVEQIYVRPSSSTTAGHLKAATPDVAFVPPMTGLSTEEPVYTAPKLEQLLGQGKPGEMLRNVLAQANASEDAWEALTKSIRKLFNYTLLPPNATGASIVAEYQQTVDKASAPRFDIASAGSGFQQVLMLLALLHTRPAAVLLLDEPDAHLHVLLQDAIYAELREVAAMKRSQLIIATHSEVVINSVDPRELCVVLAKPRMLTDFAERRNLVEALRAVDNVDIMLAETEPGVLYVEDYTDIETLRAFARALGHPAYERLFSRNLYWRKTSSQTPGGSAGLSAVDHYRILKLVRDDLPGLRLVDGDGKTGLRDGQTNADGLKTLVWKRYEIESYLVHPDALGRFVATETGTPADGAAATALRAYLEENLTRAILREPLGDHDYLNNTKSRTNILPPALEAGGIIGMPYTRYHEIAAQMKPEEIHPEISDKLDAILDAFGLGDQHA